MYIIVSMLSELNKSVISLDCFSFCFLCYFFPLENEVFPIKRPIIMDNYVHMLFNLT